MKIFNLYEVRSDYTAGSKAPADVNTILRRFPDVIDMPFPVPEYHGFVQLLLSRIKRLWMDLRLIFSLPSNSAVFLQLPGLFLSGGLGAFFVAALRAFRRIHIVVLIHDIDFVRRKSVGEAHEADFQMKSIIKFASAIIVHNSKMRQLLIDFGADERKLVDLQVFDYLIDGFAPCRTSSLCRTNVVIAGNLWTGKTGYLRNLNKVKGIDWCLYGIGFDPNEITGDNIHYEGCFTPEALPKHLKHGFGLVWDGDSINTCNGPFGEYLRINNPHKLSLYLASGLPVIIWSQAAEAEFVNKNGVGVLVDSLMDIPKVLKGITDDQFRELDNNVLKMSERLRRGDFFADAFEKSLAICQ